MFLQILYWMFCVMKIKFVEEKFWDSGFQWFDVLEKEEKKN